MFRMKRISKDIKRNVSEIFLVSDGHIIATVATIMHAKVNVDIVINKINGSFVENLLVLQLALILGQRLRL